MKKAIIAVGLCSASLTYAAVNTDMYGFVKASYMMTDKIKQANTWKPFYANDGEVASDLDNEARTQLSSTNSRWGFTANNGSKTSAKFEFDLDASAGSGAQSLSTGRVRQAHLVYKMSEDGTITFGKKWTTFTGVNPFTYQATKISFNAGNNGFLVDGVEYARKMGDTNFSVELAQNSDTDVTQLSAPTITLDLGQKFGDHKIGLAYTTANLKHKTVSDTDKDSTATGTKLYYAGKFGATSAVFQYTMGSNLGSIHTGGLGKAVAATDDEIKETGILASAKYAGDDWSIFGSYGVSELAKAEEAGSAGIAKNALMSLGFDKNLDEGLTVFVEHLAFTTGYYVLADDKVKDSTGSLTEIGMRFKF